MKMTTIHETLAAQPHVPPNHRRERVDEYDQDAGVHRIYRGVVDDRPDPATVQSDRRWRRVMWAVLIAVGVLFVLGVLA